MIKMPEMGGGPTGGHMSPLTAFAYITLTGIFGNLPSCGAWTTGAANMNVVRQRA